MKSVFEIYGLQKSDSTSALGVKLLLHEMSHCIHKSYTLQNCSWQTPVDGSNLTRQSVCNQG
eukprot:5488211-Amphidinium_carterae.1